MPDSPTPRRRVLLLGWDAADWKIITPLLERGDLPFLAQLVREGVMGNIATLTPALSPLLWTSIATGRSADSHGILGFSEPRPDGLGLRLASSASRRCPALWNILAAHGRKPAFVHWFATHPVEPVADGVIISDLHAYVTGDSFENWPLPAESVFPPELRDIMTDLRVHPKDVTIEQYRALAPHAAKPGLETDRRAVAITQALASFGTTHAVGTWLAEHGDWDLLAVYYRAPDELCHDFMEYRAPVRAGVSHVDHLRWGEVVDNTYRMLDASLGRYMRLVGPETTIVIVSDHGFHCDHLRPSGASTVAGRNPVTWHREYGIFVARGPGLKRDERVYGASLLDVAPTLLALLGLPVARNFEGKVLATIFDPPPQIREVDTFDTPGVFVPGGDGSIPDPAAEQAAMRQLVRLGYLPELPVDVRDQLHQVQRERLRALAFVHLAANRHQDAAARLLELRAMAPEDQPAARLLAACYAQLGRLDEADALLAPLLKPAIVDPAVLVLAGQLRAAQGRDAEALQFFERARAEGAADLEVMIALGGLHLSRGRHAEALAAFEAAVGIDPESAPARTGFGVALQRLGRNEEAAEQLMRSVALRHQQSSAHHHLGLALLALGHLEWARRAFTVSLGFKPANPEAHDRLAEICARLDQHAVAAHHDRVAAGWRAKLAEKR